ncbi:zinc finger protein-domain-containing protein [Phyllosticta citribraziliensis]
MAGALAAMHWGARVDARDVEFVVGSPPSSPPLLPVLPGSRFYPRQPDTPLRFWLLDFNQCGDMSFDEAGVRRAVDAFWMNDPYYPRPPRRDGVDDFEGALWDTFVARFLEISEMILAGEEPGVRNLPAMFVDALVERARR